MSTQSSQALMTGIARDVQNHAVEGMVDSLIIYNVCCEHAGKQLDFERFKKSVISDLKEVDEDLYNAEEVSSWFLRAAQGANPDSEHSQHQQHQHEHSGGEDHEGENGDATGNGHGSNGVPSHESDLLSPEEAAHHLLQEFNVALKQAQEAFMQGQFDTSLTLYNEIEEDFADCDELPHHVVLAGRSIVYLWLEKHEEALKDAHAALRRNPDSEEALLCCAHVLFAMNDIHRASMAYDHGANTYPSNPEWALGVTKCRDAVNAQRQQQEQEQREQEQRDEEEWEQQEEREQEQGEQDQGEQEQREQEQREKEQWEQEQHEQEQREQEQWEQEQREQEQEQRRRHHHHHQPEQGPKENTQQGEPTREGGHGPDTAPRPLSPPPPGSEQADGGGGVVEEGPQWDEAAEFNYVQIEASSPVLDKQDGPSATQDMAPSPSHPAPVSVLSAFTRPCHGPPQSFSGQVGFSFVPLKAMEITALGRCVPPGAQLRSSHLVQLWNASRVPLVQAFVNGGSDSDAQGNPIELLENSVILRPGRTYYITSFEKERGPDQWSKCALQGFRAYQTGCFTIRGACSANTATDFPDAQNEATICCVPTFEFMVVDDPGNSPLPSSVTPQHHSDRLPHQPTPTPDSPPILSPVIVHPNATDPQLSSPPSVAQFRAMSAMDSPPSSPPPSSPPPQQNSPPSRSMAFHQAISSPPHNSINSLGGHVSSPAQKPATQSPRRDQHRSSLIPTRATAPVVTTTTNSPSARRGSRIPVPTHPVSPIVRPRSRDGTNTPVSTHTHTPSAPIPSPSQSLSPPGTHEATSAAAPSATLPMLSPAPDMPTTLPLRARGGQVETAPPHMRVATPAVNHVTSPAPPVLSSTLEALASTSPSPVEPRHPPVPTPAPTPPSLLTATAFSPGPTSLPFARILAGRSPPDSITRRVSNDSVSTQARSRGLQVERQLREHIRALEADNRELNMLLVNTRAAIVSLATHSPQQYGGLVALQDSLSARQEEVGALKHRLLLLEGAVGDVGGLKEQVKAAQAEKAQLVAEMARERARHEGEVARLSTELKRQREAMQLLQIEREAESAQFIESSNNLAAQFATLKQTVMQTRALQHTNHQLEQDLGAQRAETERYRQLCDSLQHALGGVATSVNPQPLATST